MSSQHINNRGDSRATPASGELFSTAFFASRRGSRGIITSHLNLHTLINTRCERHLTQHELSAMEARSPLRVHSRGVLHTEGT